MNREFSRFCGLLAKLCGLELTGQEKAVGVRLARVMRAFKVSNLTQLADRIELGDDAALIAEVIGALVSTRTQFFGDRAEFERFRLETLPRLRGRRSRVWCAGCASGQEPYSLAMTLAEAAPSLMGARIEILATDISRSSLEQARSGLYSQFEVQRGLSAMRLLRHFEPHEGLWRVKEKIRSPIVFREFNLLDDFTTLGRFDAIFCLNVLDHFATGARRDAKSRLLSALAEGGVLFLGGARTELPADMQAPLRCYRPQTARRLLEIA
jgi:chemotaxis protein methyltransferase CheR